MNPVLKMLDRCKELCRAETDTALAKCLGVSRQCISTWRGGHAFPDPVSCAHIARILEEPVGKILGIVGEQRAVSAAEKSVWRRLATECAAVALFLAASMHSSVAEANAGLTSASHNVYNWLKNRLWPTAARVSVC